MKKLAFLAILICAIKPVHSVAAEKAAPAKKEHKKAEDHADHKHKKDCGHKSEKHGNHTDYEHDGHHHKAHGGHMDECDVQHNEAEAGKAEGEPAQK